MILSMSTQGVLNSPSLQLCCSPGTKSPGFSVVSVSSSCDWLSWSEKDVNNTKVVVSIPVQVIYLRVDLMIFVVSLLTENIL